MTPFVALDAIAPRVRAHLGRRSRSPIADAHYALGFFVLARRADGELVERGRAFLDALERSRPRAQPAWGYPFDWPSRYGLFRAGTPLITTMPYCYEAFEAGHDATGDPSYVATMEGIARFAYEGIPTTRVGDDADASAYTPFDRTQVVNASAYRAFLLTAAGLRFVRDDWLDAARRNIAYVLLSQLEDGSWPYATDVRADFIDNFHTCFVLKNLFKVFALTGDVALRKSIVDGYAFYRRRLLDDSGLPVPFARRPRLTLHRRDLYDYAEGISLAHLLRLELPEAEAVRERLVEDLVARWQLPDGHFVTRESALGPNRVPYHRWAQAPAFLALASVAADH